ncbi:MAG: methyltransferase domain-containing protein [Chitinispirillia bacterium]|nr:methyltransferase domain-containing protein [Chitinispirillia bacterium]MCL2267898.1 methyltransferase domain-containing protein [Chitinispirillia bacterium]
MITDPDYNFASPAGREFVYAAARFAAVNPSSRILNLGAGCGAGAATIAKEFRCKILAVDTRQGLALKARTLCEKEAVSHLVTVDTKDPFDTNHAEDPFDLIIAEGGFLKPTVRKTFFEKLPQWLKTRSWVAFADKIYTTEKVPVQVQQTFGEIKKQTLTEEAYREMVKCADLDLHYIGLAPPSNWDNYYGHMAQRIADTEGHFAAPPVRAAMHNEINIFYRMECSKYLGYLSCICRRKA